MDNKMEKVRDNRILYFDFLRIFAAFAVIVLHVTATNWHHVSVVSFQWKIFNIVDSAVRWSVPVFVMISGALFLDNDKPLGLKKLSRHILKMIIVFVVWSAVYAVDKMLLGVDADTVLTVFIVGNYHMWFIYMLVGLYIISPVLRKITESKAMTEYFLIIGFIFTFLIPRVIHILVCLDIPELETFLNAVSSAFSKMNFHLTLGYVFYFVLGFYLAKYTVGKTVRRICYGMGVVGYLVTVWLTNWYSVKMNCAMEGFYSYLSINVMLMAVAIFLFAKYVISAIPLKGVSVKILMHFSRCTFGMYLVHALVLEKICEWFHINTRILNPLTGIIGISVGVFAISYIISAIINCIPILKKYIV